MITKTANFLRTEIWKIQEKELPRFKSFLIKHIKILLIALKGFIEDRCQLRASALTFYTLLSIVPVVAMAFGIAKGFGMEKMLEEQLLEKMPGQEDVVLSIISFAHSLLDETRGGVVAGVGVALIFWAVIKMLGNIEKSFNDIWGVKRPRNLGRKFSDYLSVMLLGPVLLIMSSSITVFIASQVELINEKIAVWGAINT